MYRDEHQRCPRCRAELTDAVVGMACAECRGLWLAPSSVQEMATRMHSPPVLVELPILPDASRDKLACPICGEAMELRSLYQVPLDICEKHGIWFDADELAKVLMAASRNPPPVEKYRL